MAHHDSAGAALASPTTTVRDLLAEFLAWTEQHRAQATFEWYTDALSGAKAFAASVKPTLLVRDVKPFHLNRWID